MKRTVPAGVKPAEFKEMCNWGHTTNNALHRYSIDGDVVRGAVAAIEAHIAGEIPAFAVLILRPDFRSKDRSLYAVLVDGEWLPIIYCTATKSPVTILPQSALVGYEEAILSARSGRGHVAPDPTIDAARTLLLAVLEKTATGRTRDIRSAIADIKVVIGMIDSMK